MGPFSRDYGISLILKVAWFGQEGKVTWEPAINLPKALIDEF